MTANPLIFDLVRGSQVDGPGLRTTVFLKGCPLRCLWCHNPESQAFGPELNFAPEHCDHCGECTRRCPQDAIHPSRMPPVNRLRCDGCGLCLSNRCQGALAIQGRPMQAEDLLERLLRDRVWYRVSGGGVTFSGGEPLVHGTWLAPICKILAGEGIPVIFETCGYFALKPFVRFILPYTTRLLFDLKLIDESEHRRFTGRSNRRILSNFRKLNQLQPDLIRPRIPLIPGFTASARNLDGLARFLAEQGFVSCQLLPYHGRGEAKWRLLDRTPPGDLPPTPMNPGEVRYWQTFMARRLPGMATTDLG